MGFFHPHKLGYNPHIYDHIHLAASLVTDMIDAFYGFIASLDFP